MRLICPQCNALYDVSSAMIPPEGREVECSACGHVWHQPADIRQMRGLASDLRALAPKSAPAAAAVELGEAPALRRPLPDDVLSILREETARELSARRGVRLEDPLPRSVPPADSPVVAPPPKPADPPPTVAKPVAETPKPVEPTPPVAAKPAAPPRTVVAPPPATDWPATTVTAPDDSQPRVIPRRQPATPTPSRDLRPTPILASAPTRPLAEDTLAGASAEVPPTVVTPNPPLPPLPRRRIVKMLPDAERLAATLQTQAPPAPDLPAVVPVAQTTPDGYRAGFSRALSVAAALLLAYVVGAAWVGTGGAPAPVVSAVAGIDAARAGLQDVARSLVGQNEKAE